MTARGWTSFTALLAGVMALVGCRAHELAPLGCKLDTQCPTGEACVAAVCVARARPTGTWAVELTPPSDSPSALTEINMVKFEGDGTTLIAQAKVTITGNLGPGATSNAAAHVVATVPSLIPDRPDRQFEGEWPAGSDRAPLPFTLSVPESMLGQMGFLKVIPTPPDDHKQAPVSVAATLARDMWISLPTDVVTVRGRLVDAIGDKRDGFQARAFQGKEVVSNIAETQMGGSFSLSIPLVNLAGDPTRTVTIELGPKDDKGADPRFTTHPITVAGNADLGDVHLPSSGDPNVFRFDVRGDSLTGPPVNGAVVRARSTISGSTDGDAEYARGGLTDAQGITDLALLPGTADMSRLYDLTVIPAPGSIYGVLCVPAFPLAAGGTITLPALARKIALPRRPLVSGRILTADGSPVASMTVTATRLDATVNALIKCGSTAVAGSASVATDRDGRYNLPLDPGTYRLDYDPPAGAAVPRLTELSVAVMADQAHDIQLSAGTVVEGTVTTADGTPLASTAVRLFALPAMSKEAVLWAVGRSDMTGKFRMVIPQGN